MLRPTKIVLLADNFPDYLARIQSGVTAGCSGSGYRVVLENSYVSGKPVMDVIADEEIAGVILTPPLSDDRHLMLNLEKRRLPFVRISALLDPGRGSGVLMDEYDAARAVTDLMLSKGHRRVAIMRGPNSHLVSMRRYNGYAAALGSKGLRVDQALVAQGDFSRESGREQAAKLFAAKPTAIFASNDDMAAGIIDAANAAGIAVPGEISIVGYDDNAIARRVRPQLTSVRQPLEKMGEAAGKLLVEHIRQPSRATQTLTIPHEIVERESVVEFVADAVRI